MLNLPLLDLSTLLLIYLFLLNLEIRIVIVFKRNFDVREMFSNENAMVNQVLLLTLECHIELVIFLFLEVEYDPALHNMTSIDLLSSITKEVSIILKDIGVEPVFESAQNPTLMLT